MIRSLILFCFFLTVAWPAVANDDYTVSDIKINLPTENAVTARDVALEEALKQAYETLRTRRAALGENLPANPALWQMMKDFEVADERISATRYLGTFTIRFQPQAVAAAGASVAPADAVTTDWQQQSAIFRFQNLAEWQAARAMLQSLAAVRHLHLVALRRNQVEMSLGYSTTSDALLQALLQRGFSVTNGPDNNSWLLAIGN